MHVLTSFTALRAAFHLSVQSTQTRQALISTFPWQDQVSIRFSTHSCCISVQSGDHSSSFSFKTSSSPSSFLLPLIRHFCFPCSSILWSLLKQPLESSKDTVKIKDTCWITRPFISLINVLQNVHCYDWCLPFHLQSITLLKSAHFIQSLMTAGCRGIYIASYHWLFLISQMYNSNELGTTQTTLLWTFSLLDTTLLLQEDCGT